MVEFEGGLEGEGRGEFDEGTAFRFRFRGRRGGRGGGIGFRREESDGRCFTWWIALQEMYGELNCMKLGVRVSQGNEPQLAKCLWISSTVTL